MARLLLSDHTSALKTEAKEDEQMWHQQIPDPMMPTRIKELLEQAQTKSQTVIIYTNVTDLNQRFQIPIIGRIQGWENQMLYLGDANLSQSKTSGPSSSIQSINTLIGFLL